MESKAKLIDVNRVNGKFRLTFELEDFHKSWTDSLQGTLRLTMEKWKETRSNNANKLFWECVGRIAAALRSDKWSVYLQLLKDYGQHTYICVKPAAVPAIKKQWRETEEIGEIDINGEPAMQLLCYYGSHTYNTEEFSILIDGAIREMEQMGLPTPADDEVQRKLEAWGRKSSGAA